MACDALEALASEITRLETVCSLGRIGQIAAGSLVATGLSRDAVLGDRVSVLRRGALPVSGEIATLSHTGATILLEGTPEGCAIGDAVRLLGPAVIAPDEGWLGRIIDPDGQPLDGRPLRQGTDRLPLQRLPPSAAGRGRLGARLDTGLAAFDTLLPIVRGQRIGLFAGSGVGKSTLMGAFAKGVSADIAVIALVGERGRELREFVEEILGAEGLRRAVVVVATSDQPALLRRRCAWAAMTVAEYFRDLGHHVFFMADSVTRFAEAHREIALASGEAASLRGYPPSTSPAIMTLAERAGPGPAGGGDITGLFSVLVAGSDMEEPVADILRGALDGHVVLDRAIAERGRFPAVDLLRSVSRSLPAAASPEENALISRARHLLGTYERAELMIRAGLYAPGSDPVVDAAIKVWQGLDGFLAEPSQEGAAGAFSRLADVLAVAESGPA